MLLESIDNYLYNTKKFGSDLLKIQLPNNRDYDIFEQSFRLLCSKGLIGSMEFFSIELLVNEISMNKEYISKLLGVDDKTSFISFCKEIIRNSTK